MGRAPLLRFRLPDDRKATLLLGTTSTVLSVEDSLVSSWDLAGRPYALVRGDGTYRRGLDGHLLRKREAIGGSPRLRERLSPVEGEGVVEVSRAEAALALESLTGDARWTPPYPECNGSTRAGHPRGSSARWPRPSGAWAWWWPWTPAPSPRTPAASPRWWAGWASCPPTSTCPWWCG